MLTIADHTFSSRLFTGTGKFARPELMAAAIEASGSNWSPWPSSGSNRARPTTIS